MDGAVHPAPAPAPTQTRPLDGGWSFRDLADQIPVGIFLTDAQGSCIFVNRRWCQIAGLDPERALGQGWTAALHPDDRDRVREEWSAAAREGRESSTEFRFRTPAGVVTWLHGTAVALRGPDGQVLGYAGSIADITPRKQAETRLEAILGSIDDHVVSYDRRWCYTFVNEGAARVLGRSREELLGRCIWELFPDAVGNQYYRELHQALAEQRVIRSVHFYPPFQRWYENHIYPSPDGVTVFSADVTWRREMEEELERQNRLLAEADRLKDQFLATLAHELRNPLAPIRSALEVMKLPRAGPESIEQARDIAARQVSVMARLLDDLLDVSRIGRGAIELRREEVVLQEIVGGAVESVRGLIESLGHRLSVSGPDAPLRLNADPVRLEQILINLLNNAAKYTPPGGRIEIAVAGSDGAVIVRVRDSGVGITPELLSRVFDPFVQGGDRPNPSQSGVGIGLTLVRKLVELHGGTVTLSSPGPGQGTEVVVRVPVTSP